ncbi:MAG: sensor histidine kinase [Gammaproteobacteria bacterium]
MTLFWKIFLSFWLATLAIAGASIWSTAQFVRDRMPPWPPPHVVAFMQNAVNDAAPAAVRTLEDGGPQALRTWVERSPVFGRAADRVYLLDVRGRDALGRTVPEAIRAAGSPRTVQRGAAFVVSNATGAGGAGYRLVVLLPRPPARMQFLLRNPELGGLRLLVTIVVSGVVSYWLAHFIARPLARLREAARRIAHGDLGARAGAEAGGGRDEIGALSREFDTMAERLQALIESHRQLLSDVSHELRSPLARLQVALGLLRQRGGTGLERPIARIEHEAEHLNTLIEELLCLARLEAGGTMADASTVNLADLAEAIVEDANFEAEGSGREVRLSCQGAPEVVGSALLLGRAIENVVRNAVAHAPPGGVVEVGIDRPQPEQVRITVLDTGPGVPEHMLGRIFEPFVRVDSARGRDRGGTGLGLAIAARAVAVHRGSVVAHNRPGAGLAVEIVVPTRAAVPPQARGSARAVTEMPFSANG